MLEKKLAESIRQGNYDEYLAARYPAIPDYEELVFTGEDFSDTDFSRFPLSMNVFRGCVLDRAQLSPGQPIYIEGCSAVGLNVKGISAVIFAKNSDFTGLVYDVDTVLARAENGEAGRSRFEGCALDEKTARHFAGQGARILSFPS